eukprot:CAMPEP_0197714948 /NCGR_PEP_ID=MMETSP1338-20131121/131215_1 /TAXON_ID=43686 ORGANISM="Pelagodinium beii, Strain RCC1491" /NCGR_SAMPLE_ID=MMETSP1338 /ASSEMBLY_ACC=CAM_ASM_000754 /LENGTH=90 /DNA_ID=CAMNT_0043298891 /DNA_START=647 /DNA_END=920 /DNA_ORIENTATION=+
MTWDGGAFSPGLPGARLITPPKAERRSAQPATGFSHSSSSSNSASPSSGSASLTCVALLRGEGSPNQFLVGEPDEARAELDDPAVASKAA